MLFGRKSIKNAIHTATGLIMKNKGISTLLMALFLSVLFSQSVYARDVRVFFNGKEIPYAVPAQIIADYTMVPLSQTFEALVGAGTSYDPVTRTSTFHANGHVNVHTIGTNYVYIDGVPREYPTPSVVINDRALVPIRMITETSGLVVEWDAENYFVKISSPQPVETPKPDIPQPSTPVVISSVTANKTTVTPGESIIITVTTNNSANHVWFNDGTKNVSMTYAASDDSGSKTWVLSFTPTTTINLPIYASAAQDMSGAVQQTLAVTVGPTSTIDSLAANKTTIAPGEEITLTIKTNSAVTYVRADYDSTNVVANYTSTDAAGIKTWTAVVKPTNTQNIVVYANTTQTTTGAATQNLAVNVSNTAIAILSVSANRTSINAGETVQMTIKTSAAANYVWANFNNTSVQATHTSTDSNGLKNWVVNNCTPNQTQQIVILANSTQTTSGAVTNNSTTITVTGSAVSIINSSAPQAASGSNVTVSVQTSAATNYLVIGFSDGQTLDGSYKYTDGNGYKVWEVSYYATANVNYTVYAGSTYGSREVSKTFSLNVTSTSGVKILEVYPNIIGFGNVYCQVTTNDLADEVYFIYNNNTYYFTRGYNSNNIVWTLSADIQYDGFNKQATVYAVSTLLGGSPDTKVIIFSE